MVNLIDYYFANITEDSFYYKFYKSLGKFKEEITSDYLEDDYYCVFSTDDAVDRFKVLVQPRDEYTPDEDSYFKILCYFLFCSGYEIVEFPTCLSRPKALRDFSYGEIRSYIYSQGKDSGEKVEWEERRIVISQMHFKLSFNTHDVKKYDEIFRRISTRNATFNKMSDEEKLEQIANAIEYLLWENTGYKRINSEKLYFDFIQIENIKQYRKKLQCFRHCKEHSLQERESLKEYADFLIYYGLAIISQLSNIDFQ